MKHVEVPICSIKIKFIENLMIAQTCNTIKTKLNKTNRIL